VATSDLGEAVDRVKRMRPDLPIVRPYINSMPGPAAARYLRSLCPGLPVLIVDGLVDDAGIQARNAAHSFYIFPKPFGPDRLLDKVREILRTRERAR
jgi:DNA-binding NarL/FixJ family response regulator